MNDILFRGRRRSTPRRMQLRQRLLPLRDARRAEAANRDSRWRFWRRGRGAGARKSDAEVFLIDRRNHHIFQPLLYQVATAVLSPSEVAAPIRQLARKQKNLSVMLAEVTDLDLKSRSVTIRSDGIGTKDRSIPSSTVGKGPDQRVD